MPKIIFGLSDENIDPSEYRDGVAASAKDCYQLPVGQEQHFRKRQGLVAFAEASGSCVQGFYTTFAGEVLAVVSGIVYTVSASGVMSAYSGQRLNTSKRCVFTEDFDNVFIAHGGKIAKLDTTSKTVSFLAGNSPDGVSHVAFSQGYLLSNGLDSDGIAGDTNYSDDQVNGYTAWEVYNNERLPDGCNALVVGWDAEIYAFGPNSVEVSYNDGSTPWAVLQGAYMQYGLLAAYAVVIADNTLFWLTEADGARRVVKMVDRAPSIISGPYDALINELATVSDARFWTQQIDGYIFLIMAFPAAGKTFAYKIDDGSWSELTYYNSDKACYEAYRGDVGIYVRQWNKVLIGDRASGKIYEQGGLTDNGDAIRMELTSGQMESGTLKAKAEKMLFFRVKKGYEEGGTFQYRLRDDNRQWKNEKSLSLGALGNTNPYIKRPSGGTFRSRQYQIIHADLETSFIFMGLENNVVGTGR
jgi:hypothetical protein